MKHVKFCMTPWIGLLELSGEPTNEILAGSRGAFSNFIARADSASMFFDLAEKQAKKLGLHVVTVKWSEPLQNRQKRETIDKYLLDYADTVSTEGVFGKFYVWESDT